MKKFILMVLGLFTIFFTTVIPSASAAGWGFRRNGAHETPEIGKYQSMIEGTNSYYVGDTTKKDVYLTFDAGYDNGILSNILDTLQIKHVKASFFITGDFVKRFPALTKRIVDEGHIACNHSYAHKKIQTLSKDALKADLQKLEDVYYQLTNQKLVPYFRPPEGEFDRTSLENLNSLGYKTVFWSIAYKDWDVNGQKGAEYCQKAVMDNLHNGAIILMHSVSKSNAEALPQIIDEILGRGYTFKTVLDLA